MGCDVHMFLDYDVVPRGLGRTYTRNFSEIDIARDYTLFGLLSNGQVRWGGAEGLGADVDPRGLPRRVSQTVANHFLLFLTPEGRSDEDYEDNPYYTSRQHGGMFHEQSGSDFYKLDASGPIAYDPEIHGALDEYGCPAGAHWRVENPDWHTPSWMVADELDLVQDAYVGIHQRHHDQLAGAIGAMRGLEDKGNLPRLLWWFDN